MKRLFSWNVNGLRAVMKKGFNEVLTSLDADVLCVQETKMHVDQVDFEIPGYEAYWNQADKRGYSGVAVFTRIAPLNVTKGIGIDEHDHEGRVLTLEYDSFYLVNVYTPNSQDELKRLDYRMAWDQAFRNYVADLAKTKPVVICGDLNVAHKEIDLKNPKTNRKSAGFSDSERESFGKLLDAGFVDTFRHLHPDAIGAYSWWSYKFRARERNTGWRIDYFLVSKSIEDKVTEANILCDIMGSDHCPVQLTLDL